jgi:hypothetical protein
MMTTDNLKRIAPSVFTTSPSPKMSNKYTFVPTMEILENFENEGWNVFPPNKLVKVLLPYMS